MSVSLRSAVLVTAIAIECLAPAASALQRSGAVPPCKISGRMAGLSGVQEASGVAISRRIPGRLWTHNDSGPPVLFALDVRGAITGRVRLAGVALDDWEAIAVGPCPAGSCVYVGDIGDNAARRRQVSVYRVEEPSDGGGSVPVKEVFHATYPDGAHDAETLLVTPDGRLFIVTKGDTGAVSLYRFPNDLRSGAMHRLERVGGPREPKRPPGNDRVTDGTVSENGQWVVLRSEQFLTFYRAPDLLTGNWRPAGRVGLKQVGEPQGEGVAMANDGTVYLTGEGGGQAQPGTFVRLTCSLPGSGL